MDTQLDKTMRIQTDEKLRKTLYELYVALFHARQNCPNDFNFRRLTTIQTAFMGIEDFGWRVTGITPEALNLLAENNFEIRRLPRLLCRGHKIARNETTRRLFDRDTQVSLEEFFMTFLENDQTVIMLNTQNINGATFPEYIEIENPNAELFPNHGLIGWKHRKVERELLRELHTSISRKES